jgi:hypothetical protein
MPAERRAQRVRGLDEVAPRRAHDDRDHQHDLEEHADEDHEELLRLADPAHRISSGMNADAGR